MERLMLANWKKLLDKPKNLGLKAQGTGISKKLEAVGKAEENFGNSYTPEVGAKLVAALKELERHATAESGKHKLFTEATKYLTEMAAEAKKRAVQVEKDIKEIIATAILEKKVYLSSQHMAAVQALKNLKTPEDFHKKGDLYNAAVGMMKIDPYQEFFKGNAYTLVNSKILVESNRKKVTTANFKQSKEELATILSEYKKCIDKMK